MKTVLLLLTLTALIVAEYQGGHKGEQQSIDTPQDANEYVDQLLRSARQDPNQDQQDLKDVQVDVQVQSPSGHRIQVRMQLSEGQLSGIATHTQRSGQSQVQKQGQKRQIQTPLQYRRLKVKYSQVDIQTHPEQGVDADYLEGTIEDVRATLYIEYDQEEGQATFKDLQVQEPQEYRYRLKGAEQEQRQYPEVENHVAQAVHRVVKKALQEQAQESVEQYSQ